MRNNRAISLIELLVVIAIIMLLIGLLLPTLSGARQQARQLKDSTQVRSLVQSMPLFASGNRGQYPLPGALVPRPPGNIVGISGEQLNTTGSMLSVLIFNGFVPVEMCISPVESNVEHVQKMAGYQFVPPSTLPDALWDPTFRGTPIDDARTFGPHATTSTDPGNNSYAPLVSIGKRRKLWSDAFEGVVPLWGNRGPTYNQTASPPDGRYTLTDNATGVGSYTLLIHGGRHGWEGNIGWNDGHVSFETRPNPSRCAFTSAVSTRRSVPDNLFVNESDEAGGDTAPGQFARGLNVVLRPISRVTGASPNYTYIPWMD